MPSPRNEPVSETVMPEWLLSETGAAVLTERLGMRVFLGIARPGSSAPAQFCSQTARGRGARYNLDKIRDNYLLSYCI